MAYKQKKQNKRKLTKARIYVTATFNNTLVNVTDLEGNTVTWSSTGRAGFKGSRKSTSYAANIAIRNAIDEAAKLGMKEAQVFIKGPGPGRSAALRVIRSKGIDISLLADMTPDPHNGTRPRKQRN